MRSRRDTPRTALDSDYPRCYYRTYVPDARSDRGISRSAHVKGQVICDDERTGEHRRTGARDSGDCLPIRVASRLRHPDPPARRLRPRRGRAARCLHCGNGAMAAGWCARQSPRVACLDGPLQGHRRDTASCPVRRLVGGARRATRRRHKGRCGAGRRGRRGRPVAPDLHLLPSCPAARCPRCADTARGLRPHNRGDRARLPHRPAYTGPAYRARQGEDPRRAHPLSSAATDGTAGPAGDRAPRDLPRVHRGVLRLVGRVADAARPFGRGDPPGAAPGRASAGA